MDSDKIERLRERLLQCAVCMEEYKDPRILPCHHTLCLECIASVVQSSSTSGRFFRCPQCRADICVPRGGIGDLPINFYIISLQDELGCRGYTGTCDVCERDWLVSQFRCIDCDLDICRFCIHAHRLETHTDPPKILRIETTASSVQLASNRVCSEHADEILQMFCTTCNDAICVTCSCNSHKRHSVVPLNLKLQDSKSCLQSELDRLTSEKRNALKTAEAIEKAKAELVEASNKSLLELDAAVDRISEMVKQKKSQIEKEILSSEKKQKEDIENAIKDFKSYFQRIDRGLAFLLDLQDNDICLEVVDTYKDFSLKLNAARKIFTDNHIRIQHSHFTPSKYSQISDVNFGLFRNLYHHGKFGTFSRKNYCMSIDHKTLEIKRHPKGFAHVVESKAFSILLRAFVFFWLFQLLFYLGDVNGLWDKVAEFISSVSVQVSALFSVWQSSVSEDNTDAPESTSGLISGVAEQTDPDVSVL